MKQIINLNIGQCGIQIGNACWQLFCLEHGIQPDGSKYRIDNDDHIYQNDLTFFSQKSNSRYEPRALYIDLEPTVVDQVRNGQYREIFNNQNLISGRQDAANIFVRGHKTVGCQILSICLDSIRRLAQNCQALNGFIITNSIGGGTGSGFGALLMQQLSNEYGKSAKIAFNLLPSPSSAESVIEPYNAILSLPSLIQHLDVSVVLQNEGLYRVCKNGLSVQYPDYRNINRIVSMLYSSMTLSLRFQGALYTDIYQFQTNLVPYRRSHFMCSSYSPLLSAEKAYFEQFRVSSITYDCFQPYNMMAKVNPEHGKYIATSLMYRGDVLAAEVSNAISKIRNTNIIKFVDWCPTGFKVSVNYYPPTVVCGGDIAKTTRSCCMISNTTAINQIFAQISIRYDRLKSKRAFMHWYTREGMEQMDMTDAREEEAALQKDYDQANFYE